jgi:hypothetical protein
MELMDRIVFNPAFAIVAVWDISFSYGVSLETEALKPSRSLFEERDGAKWQMRIRVEICMTRENKINRSHFCLKMGFCCLKIFRGPGRSSHISFPSVEFAFHKTVLLRVDP